MNTSTTGALLAHDKLDRFRSFGAFGKPAYQSHVQLRAMLKAKRGDKFANYFSKPTVDPDAGELRWTAEVPGTARGWHEMPPEEQAQRALDLEVIRSGLMGFAQELRAQGGGQPGGAAAFASLLEQAMKVPAQGNFLYFVGDQPVIAFWGFEDPTGNSVDPAVQAPRIVAPTPAVADVLAPAVVPVEPVQKKRPWWWWLLWLLLALLLLALLLLLPRACTPGGGFDLKRAIPGMNPPDDAASAPPEQRAEGGTPGAGGGALGPGGQPPDGGAGAQGTPPATDPPMPGASQPGTDPSAPPPPDAPPDAKDKPETPPDPKQDPSTNPPPPDPNDPNAKPDPKAKPDKGMTNPPMPPVDPKAMKVPDDSNAAKKMDFLEGGWKAGEGLVDKKTQQPLDLSFKFGKDGKGEVTLKRSDGSTCSGTVQGRMNGAKLGIEGNQAIPCSNGGAYGAPKIECAKERDGQTQCYGVNADGSRYNMGMQRQ